MVFGARVPGTEWNGFIELSAKDKFAQAEAVLGSVPEICQSQSDKYRARFIPSPVCML